ncbi:MAG: hypothetical protein ACFFDW_10815 [Candidatus Thorarchaeota archaeon]
MSKNIINYSNQNYPTERLQVGIDFSKTDVINDPTNLNDVSEDIQAELVNFNRVDKIIRPEKSKIQLGSYISKDNLHKILKKDKGDKSIYRMIDHVRKNDKLEIELKKDFDLLRDFFPRALVLEVEDYCNRIMGLVEKKVEEDNDKTITPRKRRAYILAVFRSVCRKNGRNLTDELIEEVNNRFAYTRKMKLYEIYQAENELINWKFLSKKNEIAQDNLKAFYLTVVNQFTFLKEHPEIVNNPQQVKLVEVTRNYIMKFASKKETKEALIEILRHKDNDFAARLIIWSIAKYFAQELEIGFKTPEEIPGWKELFLVDNQYTSEEEQIPIRSFKYIFWSSFALRKELKELGLYPE